MKYSFMLLLGAATLVLGCGSTKPRSDNPLRVYADRNFYILDSMVAVQGRLDLNYPVEAINGRRTGSVFLYLTLDTTGRVTRAEVFASEDPVFDSVSVQAAQLLRFTPATSHGKRLSPQICMEADFGIDSVSKQNSTFAAHFVRRPILNLDAVPISEPVVIQKVEPDYPSEVIAQNIEGTVWVKIRIDTKGHPGAASILKSDNKSLDPLAISAAMKFRFLPATYNRRPVSVDVSVPFRFKIR